MTQILQVQSVLRSQSMFPQQSIGPGRVFIGKRSNRLGGVIYIAVVGHIRIVTVNNGLQVKRDILFTLTKWNGDARQPVTKGHQPDLETARMVAPVQTHSVMVVVSGQQRLLHGESMQATSQQIYFQQVCFADKRLFLLAPIQSIARVLRGFVGGTEQFDGRNDFTIARIHNVDVSLPNFQR